MSKSKNMEMKDNEIISQVHECIENAADNGYDLTKWSNQEIVDDILHGADNRFPCVTPEKLLWAVGVTRKAYFC